MLRGVAKAHAKTIAALAASALALLSSRAEAQSPPAAPEKIALGDWLLSPTMQVRVRGELRRDPPDIGGLDFYGRLSPRVRTSWSVFERSRIGLGAERGAMRAQLTLQDARAFGSPAPTASFEGERGIGELAPYEAFGEVHSSSARGSYVRLGRQVVVWGEGRLVGNADFSPRARSLDAIRAKTWFGPVDVEALAVLLEPPSPLGSAWNDTNAAPRSGTQLYGALGKWTIDPLLAVELYALARVARGSGVDLDGSRFRVARLSGETYTGALRVSGDAKGWTYGVEGAYQLGTSASLLVGGADIAAWAAAGHVSKKLEEVALTPTLRVGASYASGDDGGTTYRQFDPLLPDVQRFHGITDLFAWSNAMDLQGSVGIVPWSFATITAGYRYARLVETSGEWVGSYLKVIGRAPTGASAELGHELSATFAWRPWAPLELRAGYAGLLLGDGARAVMSAQARGRREPDNAVYASPVAHYAFTQATLDIP